MKKKMSVHILWWNKGCQVKTRVLAERAGVKLDRVEGVTLAVIKDLEKVTHGKT